MGLTSLLSGLSFWSCLHFLRSSSSLGLFQILWLSSYLGPSSFLGTLSFLKLSSKNINFYRTECCRWPYGTPWDVIASFKVFVVSLNQLTNQLVLRDKEELSLLKITSWILDTLPSNDKSFVSIWYVYCPYIHHFHVPHIFPVFWTFYKFLIFPVFSIIPEFKLFTIFPTPLLPIFHTLLLFFTLFIFCIFPILHIYLFPTFYWSPILLNSRLSLKTKRWLCFTPVTRRRTRTRRLLLGFWLSLGS